MKTYRDREAAGRRLAQMLQPFAGQSATTVIALPRGGVPVAAAIAQDLFLPLDVLVVRKLGAPGQPELAAGAIAWGGVVVTNPEVLAQFADQTSHFAEIVASEHEELMRRVAAYRGLRPPLNVANQTIIIVDDGAATGASMRAAVRAIRNLGASQVIAALPVSSMEAEQILNQEADAVACLQVPRAFNAVGEWYEHFDQVSDEEVSRLMLQANSVDQSV